MQYTDCFTRHSRVQSLLENYAHLLRSERLPKLNLRYNRARAVLSGISIERQ